MKKLLILTTLIFSVMFSSASYAEWTKIGVREGNTAYVDFETIRKDDGYVYFWRLSDLLLPSPWGDMSLKSYLQSDCKLFRFKVLRDSSHKEPMGRGIGKTNNKPDKYWKYGPPESFGRVLLKAVCNHVK